MRLLLAAAASEDDSSWVSEVVDGLFGGKAIAGYAVAAVTAALLYLLFRRRGLHVDVKAERSTLEVEDSGGHLTIVTATVVNRGKDELPLVLCQVVGRTPKTEADPYRTPLWTLVDGEDATAKWPEPMLKKEIGVVVKMAFEASNIEDADRVKAQIGMRFAPRYADIAGAAPTAPASKIEKG